MATTKFDLSTLNLSAGTHSITVRAKADGYKDSVDSEAVTYIKPYALSGTWVFNKEISVNSEFHTDVNFACNNASSVAMWCDMYDGYSCIFYGIYDDAGAATIAWVSDRGWVNNAYRTVNFGTTPQEVSKEFYEWFVENAVKLITFNIEGRFHQAVQGMTWGEWVNSEYNTGGWYINDKGIVVNGITEILDVVPTDVIIENFRYEYVNHGGGSSN